RRILKVNRTIRIAAATAAGVGCLAGASSAFATATGSGATFPAVAYQNWCGTFKSCSYTGVGSSAGIRALTAKTVDFAGSDATLTDAQLAAIGGRVSYFPTLLGAITVPVNIAGVTGNKLKLSGKEVADIFQGTITTWNNPVLVKSNPVLKNATGTITLCVRSDGSGTSWNFSRYLTKMSPAFATAISFSQTPNWPASAIKSAGNPGVANCVKSNANSVGYVDLADAIRAGLQTNVTAIGKSELVKQGGKTKRKLVYVLPSAKSIEAAGSIKVSQIKPDLTIDFTGSSNAGAYPITITTWVLAVPGRAKNGEVKGVLGQFYSPEAQGALVGLGFAPLPKNVLNVAKVAASKLG
ncbi:MAG: phosphate ABC transporter substrate-binding protein PstS, partial [Actinobacteria bacterium]|nr:phosphate ABC transporter substrate-binding protein PstS [Actinomycetota bacterium]